MLEYELNGKIYTEADLIKMAGGKNKLSAYIKNKGFKPASKKTKQPKYPWEEDHTYKGIFGFENPAKDQFSEINKTKKKPAAKKWNEVITWEDLKAEESTASGNTQKKMARFGLIPEETGFGINRITVRGDKKNMLAKRRDQYGNELGVDLDAVTVGADLSKEELIESAKRLNNYIGIYGNKDYIQKVKNENPNLVRDTEQKIQAPTRSQETKVKEYNEDLTNEFKNKEESIRSRLRANSGYMTPSQRKYINAVKPTKKDFDTPEKYNIYESWKKTNQIPLPSETELENFIKVKNDNYRAGKASELMSDAPQEQRVMLQALEAEREDKKTQKAEVLNTQSIELDKKSKALSEKMAKFQKTPPTKQEYDEIQKEYFALQNESVAYNKEILSIKKDFNNIKAVSEAASKDYSRLNQTGTFLKQTGLALVGAAVDIDITATAFKTALAQSATTEDSFGEAYTENKNILKQALLDPIYSEQKAAGKELESYQRDLQIKDIKSMKDFGRWGAGILTQMPSSMAMAVTGEAALPLFFLSGYGSKQYEIASSQEAALSRLQYNADQIEKGLVAPENMSDVQKQIASDKKTLNISEAAKLTSKVLAGTAEVLLEKYGTLGIIKQTDNILRAIPPQEIKRQLKVIGKEMGKSAGVEAWTEGLTQFANNVGDIYLLGQDKNFFDGVPDAMAGGAFMGPGFSAMGGAGTISNNITKAVVSELATKEEFKARNRKLDEIKKLTGLEDVTGLNKRELNKLKLQPPVRKAVEELIDQMDGDDLRILDRLGKDFSMEDAKKVGYFNQKLRKITGDWNEASRTGGLEDSQLKSLKDYYQKQYNEVFTAREAMLTDKQLTGKNKKENAQKRINFEATAGYGLYNYRLTRKTYLEKLAGFNKLSSEEKQKYNDLALSELNQDVTIDQLSNKEVDSKARELYAGEEIGKQLDRDIQAANDFSTEVGLNIKVETVDNKKELLEKYGKIIDEEELNDLLNGKTNGFNIDDNTLVIYKPNAIKNGHTSTGSHEVLHTVLSKAFKNNQEEANKNGIKLLEYLKTAQPSLYAAVEERMKTYKPGYQAYGEEVFNALSDSFIDGGVPNDDVFTQISKVVNKITKGALGTSSTFDIKNISTDSGKALFDTIKAYSQKAGSKKTKTGQNIRFINSDTEDKAAEGTPTAGFKASKARVIEVQKKIDNLEEQFDKGEIDYDDYTGRLEAFEIDLEKAKKAPEEAPKPEAKKVEVTEEDSDKEIIKNERGSVSSDKVQKIYEEKGINGAQEIIDLFKPITKKLVNKRMDAPGFERKLLTDEIETGEGGLLYLIRSYKPEKGVPLAAYINKQLPLRAIAASRRVLDKDFSKDVTEEKSLIAEEAATETKEKPKYNNALEAKVFSPEILKTATNKIVTIVRTLKNRIDAPVTLNRTVTPLISEIRDEVGKQLDIDIKTMLGGKKDGVLRKELLRTKKYILENMTTTWLMGKDGQGGIPQAIQKQIDGKFVSYPDWVGQKIDREKTTTDQAGRTSGAELVRRLPNVNNNVSNEDFLAQIIGPDGNPIRGRKESLSKAMAEEGAFDIINADFAEEGPIFEAFATNQERLGVEVASNVVAEFVRQSERGNIKFSKSLMEQLNLNQDKLANNISINGKMNLNNIRLALINTFPNWRKEDIDKVAIKLTPSMISVAKQMRTKKKVLPKDLLSNVVENIANSIDDGVAMRNKFNSNISVAEFFRNPLYRADLRILDLGFSNFILNKYGKKEGLDILSSLWMPTVAGKTASGIKAPFSIYDGVNDFNQHLKALQRNTDDGELIEINQKYKKNNTIFNNNFDGTFDKTKDKLKSGKAKELSILAAEWFSKEILKEDNTYGPEHLAAIYTLFIKENNSALRSAAPVVGTIIDKRIKDIKKYDYDHSKPVSYVARRLADKFVYGLDVDLDLLFKDYEVTIIPKVVSSKLSKLGLQSMMPLNYVEGSGSAFRINAATTQTVDRYEEFINNIDVKQPIIEEAIVNSFKFSKSPKGISVFDFDDTVGLTKGSVLYTMPDGPKGKLNAEEFAKKGAKFLEEGAVFDFSEFSKVVDGKPGPMVEKMKKMIGKFGPENFFILTARPANAAGPIYEFLSSIGIDIPLENITGLGNSTAQAKADWMTAKAAEGYNDFYFADDAPQNVEAVKKALNIPGINSKVQQAIIKFSLTTKVKLDWESTEYGGAFTNFKIGEYTYDINLAPIKEFGHLAKDPVYVKAFQNIADNLGLPLTYLTDNNNLQWVTFAEEDMGVDILGIGNAFNVLGIVTNGLVDHIQKNNIDGIAFSAEEPSRIRLYKTLSSTIGTRLGWTYSIENIENEDGGSLFVLTPLKNNTLQNQSKPIRDVLNVVDVKSPKQQAKIKFSKTMSDDFNRIIEENKGVESYKVFSDITARRRGVKKNRFDFYVPPSAADFELLLYKFMGKGALGEEQKKFFQDALIKPYINGVNLMDSVRQSIKKEYKALLKSFPEVKKDLEKLTPNKDFTYDQAMRVAIWNQYGTEIPGLSQRDVTYLTDLVNSDPELAAFKDGLIVMGRQKDGWLPPGTFWDSDTIISDLYNITEGAGRKKFLGEFIENTENIFGKWEDGRLVGPNINKVEAVYGTNVREALEDSIYRMINGKNRSIGQDKETSAWSSWVNGSTGAIMFMNTRSAALQMLGAVNFLNWRDNNPFNAGKAFLNQPQYWKDFSRIWNSDKLKERRGGLREDVASAEIANAAAGSKNKVVAVTSYLLKVGYTPTQLADSFAIASGGAPFYRNRVNSYLKEGLTEQEAEAKAWQDFSKVSDETQQSGDPKDISKQQSSAAGRLLLVFQNFTMQQSRIVKKAALDLKNGRGDAKTNISKIFYYLAVQNIMFSTLQQGLFAVAFDDDDDEDKDKKKKTKKDAAIDVANGVLDSILRGTGFVGGITATLKNTVIKYLEEREKKQKAEYAKVVLEVANMSPPIGSKLRKTYSALQQTKYDKDLIAERGWGVMQDGRVHLGPMYSVTGKLVEVGTNFPMDRLVNKVENVSQAFNSENTVMQRIATAAGYSPYSVGIEGTKGDILIKETAKEKRAEEGTTKSTITKKENAKKLEDSINRLPAREYYKYMNNKREEKYIKAEKRRKILEKLNAN